jgi:acyl-CoA thioester hydrolase
MTVDGPACFRYDSAVYFDEMDPLGVMHNSRFAVHIERAQSALFEHLGYGWTELSQRHEDINYVVRGLALEFTAPVGVPRASCASRWWPSGWGARAPPWGYRCAAPGPHGDEVRVAHGDAGCGQG